MKLCSQRSFARVLPCVPETGEGHHAAVGEVEGEGHPVDGCFHARLADAGPSYIGCLDCGAMLDRDVYQGGLEADRIGCGQLLPLVEAGGRDQAAMLA